jgi:uncharacterized glyoxalase superfamily protein PhnB
MKPTPKGWPRISCALYYDDPAKAIDWLCAAFGFTVRIKVEDAGKILHSELELDDGVIMVSGPRGDERRSPQALGGGSASFCVQVDDVDAFCARARAAGAKVIQEPKNQDYGAEYWEDRGCELEDLGGHRWWFVQRIRSSEAFK